jgi:hypothetical protein
MAHEINYGGPAYGRSVHKVTSARTHAPASGTSTPSPALSRGRVTRNGYRRAHPLGLLKAETCNEFEMRFMRTSIAHWGQCRDAK